MKKFPETGFLRLPHIIGDPKAKLPIPPIIPVNKSCWWAGVKGVAGHPILTHSTTTRYNSIH